MKQKIAFALLMGIVTTGLISFTLIYVNVGFKNTFLETWIKSWLIAYSLAVPAVLFVGPLIQKLVTNLFREKTR
jgi:Protein of unknown function (DUF2798)